MSNDRISVVIVDDHLIVRQGLRMLLENVPGLEVVGEAGRCGEALEVARRTRPDVVLLDVDLAGENALEIVPELLAIAERLQILLLTGSRDVDMHRRAVRLGASGVVLKDHAADLLVKAVQRVHAGEVWLDRGLTAQVLQELRQGVTDVSPDDHAARIASLTTREREIVALIAQGASTHHMAEKLFISEKTVRNHLASIYDKLQVSERLELALYAAKHGLAPAKDEAD